VREFGEQDRRGCAGARTLIPMSALGLWRPPFDVLRNEGLLRDVMRDGANHQACQDTDERRLFERRPWSTRIRVGFIL
jgi:hypothetical protein